MKTSLLVILSVLFFSCKNKEEKKEPVANPNADSITIPRPERTVNPYAIIDVSPMDMTYYPVDYPKLKMDKTITTPPLARVIYSRPHLQGRHIFHEVLKYGEPWRLGANEATELDLYADASIQNTKVKAGRYILYCIPEPDKWTIVLNSNIDSWGLEPDPSKDIVKFTVPVKQTANSLEYFTMVFEKNNSIAELVMAWDNAEARLPISF